MSQISPPLRILLAGCVLFMAAWFTVLKPGEPEAPAVAPTDPAAQAQAAADGTAAGQPASAAGQAVQQAQAAAAGTAPAPATAPATGTQPATPAPQAGAPQADTVAELVKAGVPERVAKRLDREVVVLAFVNDSAAEDRRVRGGMKKVFHHRGKVWVHTASIDDVSKYAPLTRGANVDQSPTVLVVDKHRSVTPLVGYVDSVSINQVVVDALLVDGRPVDDSPYLQKLEGVCSTTNRKVRRLRDPRSVKDLGRWLHSFFAIADRFHARMRGVKAPAKYRALDRDLKRFYAADAAAVAKLRRWVHEGRYPAAAATAMLADLKRQSRRLDLELAGLGMNDCR